LAEYRPARPSPGGFAKRLWSVLMASVVTENCIKCKYMD